jgi:hypothetical protein
MGLSDTHPEVERIQIDIFRRLTETDRLHLAFQLTKQVWGLAYCAFVERYPESDPVEQRYQFLAAQYGPAIAFHWREIARRTDDHARTTASNPSSHSVA